MKKEVRVETDGFRKKKEKALNLSIVEGSMASASVGVSSSYITPFALKLAAQPIHIGIISSLASLVSPLAQLKGSSLMEKYRRKSIATKTVILQAILWLPISLLAILAWKNIAINYLLYAFILFYTILVALGGLAHPAWFSWMGDLISDERRGRYFSKRNRITGIVDFTTTILAVILLQFLENKNFALVGFAILFFLAFVFRFASFTLLKAQYSPHLRPRGKYKINWKEFLKNNGNFKKFAVYQMFFNFAIMVASPFFAVYMLEDLKFSYITFIIVSLSSVVFYLIFMSFIGKWSDKYGNLKLLYLSNAGFALTPILWIFIKSPLMLILIPQLISGLANAAFVIAFSNFTYDALSEEKRGAGIAYVNLFVGIGSFIGALIGGILLNYINISFMNKFLFVFALAASLRLLVALFYLPRIKEEKKVKRAPYLLSLIVHPYRTIQHEVKHFVYRANGGKLSKH